mgnify:CR=1 FL=1
MTPQHEWDLLRQIREAVEFERLESIRNDLCQFAEYTQVDENGKPVKLGAHHREWFQIIWEQIRDVVENEAGHEPPPHRNLLLMAPRNHGKSTSMVTLLQFILGKNPRLRVKYVSRNDKLSLDIVGQVKKNIEFNAKLHEVFPRLKKDPNGSWSGSAIDVVKVTKEGERDDADLGIKDANLEAYGISAPATGGRADLIIFDDIIGGREAIQEPGRLEKISMAFRRDWLNIGGKRHIVIGTPWTPDDILAELSEDDTWRKWKKPAIIDGHALWPEERPISWLMEQKKLIGETAFNLQYMLEGIIQKQSWWTRAVIDRCKDPKTRFGKVPSDFEIDGVVLGFDPAASMMRDGSFSCIFALLYDKMHRKVVYRIKRKRAQPIEMAGHLIDMLLEIEATLTRKVDLVTVENNATQQAFIDLINLLCETRGVNLRVPIMGAFTGSQKWNPELGLPRMVGDFENGKWIIPWGDEAHQGRLDPLHTCDLCSWIDEMEGYPHDTPTTDMIMSSWLASSSIDKQTIGILPTTVQVRRASVTNINW